MKFKSMYGSEYEIRFVKTNYFVDGNIAVIAEDYDPDGGWWENYATLTVNLGDRLDGNQAYLDTNNVPDLCEFVIGNGWARRIGDGHSGFCTYPLVEFTAEFLDVLCKTGE